jgi:hypothetical protein
VAVSTTTVRWVLLLIMVLVALNVATVAAWISNSNGATIPVTIRDGAIAFGGTATLCTLIFYSFGAL